MTEARPNPYNADKDYGEFDNREFVDSNSLFIPPKPAKESVEESVEPVSSEDLKFEDRYKQLQSYSTRVQAQLRQEIEQLKAEKAVSTPGYVPPKTQEELEQFRTVNPDVSDAIEAQIYNQTADMASQLSEIKARENQLRQREAMADLKRIHPDYLEITQDPAFHNWTDEQPAVIQSLVNDNPYDGIAAAKAVTLYKQEMGLYSSPVNETTPEPDYIDEDAASLVPTRTAGANIPSEGKRWSRREIARLKPYEYELVEAEIDLAVAEGRIDP